MISQFALALFDGHNLLETRYLIYLITFFFIVLFYYLQIKLLIANNKQFGTESRRLLSWNRDIDLFLYQWKKNKQIDCNRWSDEIILGNQAAGIQLTILYNPFCGPCADENIQVNKLLDYCRDEIGIAVRFICKPEAYADDETTKAVSAIFNASTNAKHDSELPDIISSWFKVGNVKQFAKIWNVDTTRIDMDRLKRHHKWTKDNDITITPTFLLNGRRLPWRYSLEDLRLLIPKLKSQLSLTDK
jgi:hypothetical protein